MKTGLLLDEGGHEGCRDLGGVSAGDSRELAFQESPKLSQAARAV